MTSAGLAWTAPALCDLVRLLRLISSITSDKMDYAPGKLRRFAARFPPQKCSRQDHGIRTRRRARFDATMMRSNFLRVSGRIHKCQEFRRCARSDFVALRKPQPSRMRIRSYYRSGASKASRIQCATATTEKITLRCGNNNPCRLRQCNSCTYRREQLFRHTPVTTTGAMLLQASC